MLLEELEAIANAESPIISPLPSPTRGQKRRRASSNASTASNPSQSQEGEEPDQFSMDPVNSQAARLQAQSPDKNAIAYVQKIAQDRHFTKEQHNELRNFVMDSVLGRQIKVYAGIIEVREMAKRFQSTKAAYKVPEDLRKNIISRSLGVLLSSHLAMYKGDVPANHVMNILKQKELSSLPEDIDRDAAVHSAVVTCIKDALSEHRTRIKLAIRDSMKSPDASQHISIYSLTTKLCKKTKHCVPSVPLCARVALMRFQYNKNPSDSFWNDLDKLLAEMRKISKGDPKKLTKMFLHKLEQDRRLHGNVPEDVTLDENVEEWQQDIDSVIAGSAVTS